LLTGTKNKISLKYQAIEAIDYCLHLEDDEFTEVFTGSRLWMIINDLAKWSSQSANKPKIKNILNAKNNEDKRITVKFRDRLNEVVQKWGEDFPKDRHGRKSDFINARNKVLKNLKAKSQMNQSQMSNPLEQKKITFDKINLDFDPSLPASSYYAIVLSVSGPYR
jgi:hypothetical protein